MAPPSVSVIVPTHERRELVVTAVESVLAQTHRDHEVIVADDGSTDGTDAAIAAVGDERVRYVWQENAGVAAARNRGLELARGEIVAFLDSDNRWLPDHLAVLVEMLESHPRAVFATTCPQFALDGDEDVSQAQLLDLWPHVSTYGGEAGYISGVAIRREAIATVGGFDEGLPVGEDTDLFVRVGLLGPIVTVRRRTLIRTVRRTSLMARARYSGEYLEAAERSATNLIAAAERTSDEEVLRHARGRLHLALAFSALERADTATVQAEITRACWLLPSLPRTPVSIALRVREHLPRAQDRKGLLAAYATMAEIWPDPDSEMARFLRALAIQAALRAARPDQALRLLRARPRGGNVRFLRRRAEWFRLLAARSP